MIQTTDLCWTEGMADWQPIGSVIGAAPAVAPSFNPYAAPSVDVSRSANVGSGELASIWMRLVAHILDGLVAIPAAIPLGIGAGMMNQETGELTTGSIICFAVGGVLFLAILTYNLYLLSTQGQTLGKKWAKVRVVNFENNGRAGFVKVVLLRLIVNGIIAAIPILGALYSLIDILFIFSSDRRCLHDKIAGTHVIVA